MKRNQFEAILIKLCQVKDSEAATFRSRLRVLHKVAGVPFVPDAGKGTHIDYSVADVFVTDIAIALDAAGYPPLVIGEIMSVMRAFKQIERVMAWRNEDVADLWMKIIVLSYAFGGEKHHVSANVEPLVTHINFLKSMDASSRLPNPGPHTIAPQFMNVSQLLRDCEAAVRDNLQE